MTQDEPECISTIALREVLSVLGTHIDRVARIDVSDTRVTVDFIGKVQVDAKPEDRPDARVALRNLLPPGAVLPEAPRR